MQSGNVEISGIIPQLFRAINIVFASNFIAIAAAIAILSGDAYQSGLIWPQLLVVAMMILAGIPSAEVARRMERRTQVRTPWRAGYGLVVIVPLGIALGQLD